MAPFRLGLLAAFLTLAIDQASKLWLYLRTDLVLTQLGLNSLDELPPISPLLADGAEGFDERL